MKYVLSSILTLSCVWGLSALAEDGPTFVDVPSDHPYFDDIEALYQAGYTAGCSTDPLMYCPEATMNRAESAVFVERGIHGASYEPPSPSNQVFGDVFLDQWFARWATGLWNDGYTEGCAVGPLMYCPWQGHTRAEGAVFYLRMLNGPDYVPPDPTGLFGDIPVEAWFARWAEAAYEASLIEPCGTSPLRYCPEDGLTRAVAAHMMVRAKGLILEPTQTPGTGSIFYVSRQGNNSDGLTWATAWSELDQIDWDAVQPGDTVSIDGGEVRCAFPVTIGSTSNEPQPSGCGMVYQTTLAIRKSGTPSAPITIRLASEAGRNGTVRIFGGRSYPVPYCGQTDHPGAPPGTRSYGISVDQNAGGGNGWIVIDGLHWGGIMVYGHSRYGMTFEETNCAAAANLPQDITVRNVEFFDNGSGTTGPDGRGVRAAGKGMLFERVLIHDNGQDAFQIDSVTEDLTIRRSWLFNSRELPGGSGEAFNGPCTHSDGVQIYAAGIHSGLTVQDSIVGPGFMQAFMLGDYSSSNSCIGTTVVHDASFLNTLLVGNHGPNNKNNIQTKAEAHVQPTNYILDHVTSVRDISQDFANNRVRGSGHHIRNSVFVGGVYLGFDGSTDFSNNVCYQLRDDSGVCDSVADPMFADDDFAGVGPGFADFDFSIANTGMPRGIGSTITSVADLFAGSP
jgi:hypothetical protein